MSMVVDKFPIGETLTEVSIVEYKEFGGDELCLDKVQLIFPDITVILQPLADTDEIEIILKTTTLTSLANHPTQFSSGEKTPDRYAKTSEAIETKLFLPSIACIQVSLSLLKVQLSKFSAASKFPNFQDRQPRGAQGSPKSFCSIRRSSCRSFNKRWSFLVMKAALTDWDRDLPVDPEEEYNALVRSPAKGVWTVIPSRFPSIVRVKRNIRLSELPRS